MRAVVIGAGVSGLVAARELQVAGADVAVVDKGRSPGGRMATRRIGAATLDHGAQFFTVRTPAFARRVEDWHARDLVRVWAHGFGALGFGEGDGHPRYIGVGGMNALAKDLAVGLDLECSTMAFAVRPGSGRHRWSVVIDDGTERPADAVVVTCPLPQSFSLLIDAGVDLDESLFRTEYDRTIALLAVLDRASAVPAPGGVQEADDTYSFIGDNAAKGVSGEPAVTFHARPEWSEQHWDDDPDELRRVLLEAARPWIGESDVLAAQIKRWRFAMPQSVWPDPCWASDDGTIIAAGDAFAGPRVEGAYNSGLAAAQRLLG